MTLREKVIVSAYTGYLMCDFGEVHQYIQEKIGRSVWTHEMASEEMQDRIHRATREDFLSLCEDKGE